MMPLAELDRDSMTERSDEIACCELDSLGYSRLFRLTSRPEENSNCYGGDMPILYRPRAVSFKQSMKLACEITSLSDVQRRENLPIPLRCVYYGYNEANGWDEYKVVFHGGDHVGFTNAFLEPAE